MCPDVGDRTLADTVECMRLLECSDGKTLTLKENKQRVLYSIRKWKLNPAHGRAIYAMQSARNPTEPDAVFFQKVAATLHRQQYFTSSAYCELIDADCFVIGTEPIPEIKKK